jgi:DNA-binding NarL/FixJ family response regulator
MPVPDRSPLSKREQEVLQLAAAGDTDREIASHLRISHKTVNKYITSSMSKLNAKSRTQAVAEALRRGLLDEERARE